MLLNGKLKFCFVGHSAHQHQRERGQINLKWKTNFSVVKYFEANFCIGGEKGATDGARFDKAIIGHIRYELIYLLMTLILIVKQPQFNFLSIPNIIYLQILFSNNKITLFFSF